jgi:hypothetical protein
MELADQLFGSEEVREQLDGVEIQILGDTTHRSMRSRVLKTLPFVWLLREREVKGP